MPLVLLGDPYGGDEQFAKSVAAELGYACVDEDAIVERAAAWGASQSSLRRALQEPPAGLDRLTHQWRIQITLLQAAVAEELRDGTAIYCGSVAYLLPTVYRHVLRIRLTAPFELRSTLVQERLKLERNEAISHLRKRDRQRRSWLRALYGNLREPARADLAIDLGHTDIEAACRIIVAAAKGRERIWESWRPGVTTVDAGRVIVSMPGAPAFEADRHVRGARLRPVAAIMGATLVFVIIASILLSAGLPGGDRVQAFSGFITDTLCARSPDSNHTGECVRRCVAGDGTVKYVLYAGERVFVLGDQQAGNSFAARKVRVTGVVENGVLRIRKIQPI